MESVGSCICIGHKNLSSSKWLEKKRVYSKNLSSNLSSELSSESSLLEDSDIFLPNSLIDEIELPNVTESGMFFKSNKNQNNNRFTQLISNFIVNSGGHTHIYVASLLYFAQIKRVFYYRYLQIIHQNENENEDYRRYLIIDNRNNDGVMLFDHTGYKQTDMNDLSYLGNWLSSNNLSVEWFDPVEHETLDLDDDIFYYFDDKPYTLKSSSVGYYQSIKGYTQISLSYYSENYERIQRRAKDLLMPNLIMVNQNDELTQKDTNVNDLGIETENFEDPLSQDSTDLSNFAPTAGFKAVQYDNYFINIPTNTNIDTRLSDIVIKELQSIDVVVLTVKLGDLSEAIQISTGYSLSNKVAQWLLLYPTRGKTQYKTAGGSYDKNMVMDLVRANVRNLGYFLSIDKNDQRIDWYPEMLSQRDMEYIHNFITFDQWITKGIKEQYNERNQPSLPPQNIQAPQTEITETLEPIAEAVSEKTVNGITYILNRFGKWVKKVNWFPNWGF